MAFTWDKTVTWTGNVKLLKRMHFSKREKKTLVTLTVHTLDKELRQNFFIFTLQNIKISLRNVRMSNMIVLTVLNSSLNSDFALVFNPWTQIMPGSPSDTFSNFNGMHLSQKNIYQISWITQVFNTSCLLFFLLFRAEKWRKIEFDLLSRFQL